MLPVTVLAVFHHDDGSAADCSAEVRDFAAKYIKCDPGYEPDADFDGQNTADGKGACLFTCKRVTAAAECTVPSGHGKCQSGLAKTNPDVRFCIGGDRYCGIFHHDDGAAKDCSAELKEHADQYIKCDKGWVPTATFDDQSTPDGKGACIFACEPKQCAIIEGGHGTCLAGLVDPTTRFCIGVSETRRDEMG